MTDDHFVPYEKMSKKKKKEIDAVRRATWGNQCPVTRSPKHSAAYDRNKEKEKLKNDTRGILEV